MWGSSLCFQIIRPALKLIKLQLIELPGVSVLKKPRLLTLIVHVWAQDLGDLFFLIDKLIRIKYNRKKSDVKIKTKMLSVKNIMNYYDIMFY
jgi:hypothetical protein